MTAGARRALSSIPWWIWLAALVALMLRLVPVFYGLPYELDPDEHLFVSVAGHMVEHGTLDPGWYGVPASTLIDALAAAYAAYGLGGVAVGAFESAGVAVEAHRADVTHFFVIGRSITAISGAAVVLVAYLVARELRASVLWASVAAVSLALSWPMIEFSSIVRMDMLQAALLLAVVLLMLRALNRPTGRLFVAAGVLLGLAAASKYPGALGLVPILFANVVLTLERRVTPRQGLLWLGSSGVAALVTAVVVGPFLFINWRETLSYVLGEARTTHLGHTGEGFVADLWRYLSEVMPEALGLAGAVLGVAGLVVMLAYRRPRLVSLTFWAYLAFISALSLWWLRWALPLIPFVAIGAAFLATDLDTRLRLRATKRLLTAARIVVVALLIVPLLLPTTTELWARATNDDTRLAAIDWIHESIPDGSTVLVDAWTTPLSTERYDVLVVRDEGLMRWADVDDKVRPHGWPGHIGADWAGNPPDELITAIEDIGADYVVLSEGWIDEYRAESDDYAEELAVYEALLEAYPAVARFGRDDAVLGRPVIVLGVGG